MTKLEEAMQLVRLSALTGQLEAQSLKALERAVQNLTIENLNEAHYKLLELSLVRQELKTIIAKDN